MWPFKKAKEECNHSWELQVTFYQPPWNYNRQPFSSRLTEESINDFLSKELKLIERACSGVTTREFKCIWCKEVKSVQNLGKPQE